MQRYKDKYDLWFNTIDFVTMERITRLRQSNFSHENSYQSFVDACEQWWHETPQAEKEYIYHTYNFSPI
jgi:hypothetical protein